MAKLFKTSRRLRPYQSKGGHQIFIRVRMHVGTEIEIPVYDFVNHKKLTISVKKEYWNKGFITGGKYHLSVREINNLLSKVEYNVKDAVNDLVEKNLPMTRENIIRLTYIYEENYLANEQKIATGEIIVDDDGGAFASHDEFNEFIEQSPDPKFDSLKKALGFWKKEYILDYWDDFIRDFAPNSYNSPKYSIDEYIKTTEDNCKATKFSSEWLSRYFDYIIKNGYSFRQDGTNRQPYTVTTVTKYSKHLKRFGDYLFDEIKVLDNQEYRRFKVKHPIKKKSLLKYDTEPFINTHALYKKEFDFFYYFIFEDKQLELVRDMFVLQVWLEGLRQCDFYNLKGNNFHKDSQGAIKVSFEQKKTDDSVINTINQNYLVPILEKYPNGFDKFPKVHKYNKLLKKAAEVAGLNRKLRFREELAVQTKATEEFHEIYKKISNNWARNCAVSILSEEGYPDDRICKFTGHRDRKMINHYKQIHQKEINTMMAEVKPEIVEKL